MPTTREQAREDTLGRIVRAARKLLTRKGGFTLRAVAAEVKMTPPALYRYVSSVEDLMQLVAVDIDASATEGFRKVVAQQPEDDPAARLVAAGCAFRQWALSHKAEFHLVFTNPEVEHNEVLQTQAASGLFFHELLFRVWEKYQFAFPPTDELDEELVGLLCDPQIPIDMTDVPESMFGLIWVFMKSWVALYGTVTLEVYGHLDPRVIRHALVFRAMIADQSALLGLADELPRLTPIIDELLT